MPLMLQSRPSRRSRRGGRSPRRRVAPVSRCCAASASASSGRGSGTMIDNVGSAIEVHRRPELEVPVPARTSMPARKPSRPMPLEPKRLAAVASTEPRSRNACDANTSAARSPSGPRSQSPSGVTKPTLSRRARDVRGQQVAERATQDGFVSPPRISPCAGREKRELDESVVEEGHARLERVRHRVAVLVRSSSGRPVASGQELLVRRSRSGNGEPFEARRGAVRAQDRVRGSGDVRDRTERQRALGANGLGHRS